MTYASLSGRARTSATSPQAHAICDRCGFRYNFVDLIWQYEWRGATLQNIRILVCKKCLDIPQENVRSIVVPADPQPIINARVQDFDNASNDYLSPTTNATDPTTGLQVPSTNIITGADGSPQIRQNIGAPAGEEIIGQAPLVNTVTYAATLSPLSISSNGSKTVSMSFSAPHGLTSGQQIGVVGAALPLANGIFSVTVVTATLITYITGAPVPSASLLTATTIVRTANVGVPYNAGAVPQSGV